MPGLIFPGLAGGNYATPAVSLANTNKTTIYTVGTNGEASAVLLWVRVTDSTGSVNTAATIHLTLGGTERVWYVDTPGPDLPLDSVMPVAMFKADILKVTGASGHHVFATFLLEVPAGQPAR
jgi:hypothetical protein